MNVDEFDLRSLKLLELTLNGWIELEGDWRIFSIAKDFGSEHAIGICANNSRGRNERQEISEKRKWRTRY